MKPDKFDVEMTAQWHHCEWVMRMLAL